MADCNGVRCRSCCPQIKPSPDRDEEEYLERYQQTQRETAAKQHLDCRGKIAWHQDFENISSSEASAASLSSTGLVRKTNRFSTTLGLGRNEHGGNRSKKATWDVRSSLLRTMRPWTPNNSKVSLLSYGKPLIQKENNSVCKTLEDVA